MLTKDEIDVIKVLIKTELLEIAVLRLEEEGEEVVVFKEKLERILKKLSEE